MPQTERASYRFRVTQGDAGEYVIAFEPLDGVLPILSHCDSQLTLELKPGLTIYEARALARLLNERIEGLGTRAFPQRGL
jgi:hypothetical protein